MAIKTITVGTTTYDINDSRINNLPLPITQGGTGASTAINARSNLGLGSLATLSYNSSTATFLRNDGTWATPTDTDTKVEQTRSTSVYGSLLLSPLGPTNTTDTTTTTVYRTATAGYNESNMGMVLRATTNFTPSTPKGVFAVVDPGVTGDMNTYVLMGQQITGTATTIGIGAAILGNSRGSGQAGNARGKLALFGPETGSAQIMYDGTTESSVLIPDVDGDEQYLAAGTTTGVGNAYSPIYMTNKGVLTECQNYKVALTNGTAVTQTLPTGTYLMTLNRTGTTYTTRDAVWLLTTGTSTGHMTAITIGSAAITPTVSGRTVTATGDTSNLQLIFRRIG